MPPHHFMSSFLCGNSLCSISFAHVNLDMCVKNRTQKTCPLVKKNSTTPSKCQFIPIRHGAWRTHPHIYVHNSGWPILWLSRETVFLDIHECSAHIHVQKLEFHIIAHFRTLILVALLLGAFP